MGSGPFFDQPGRDGRRKSDPLKEIDAGPALAPDWQLYRVIAATDADPTLIEKFALNAGHYNRVRFQSVSFTDKTLDTIGTHVANLTVQQWSPGGERFIDFDDTIVNNGGGVVKELEVEHAHGQKLFVMLTSDPTVEGDVVAIYAQGYELDHTL